MGAYDNNKNFKYLQKKRITPGIKVRNNSIIYTKNNNIRNREVELQTKDLLKWKKKRKYGQRWVDSRNQHFRLSKEYLADIPWLSSFKTW